jgi:DNA polymerase-3 subunit epsilon
MLERHTAIGDALTVALMYVRLKYGDPPEAHY